MNLTPYTPVRVPYAHQIPFAGLGAPSTQAQQALLIPFMAAAKREADHKRNMVLAGVAIAAGVGLLAYAVL